MAGEPSLFGTDYEAPGHAPAVGRSRTSKLAAKRIDPKLSELQTRVLLFVRSRNDDGATDEEICEGTKLCGGTARARRVELVRKKFVRDSGRTRPSWSGRPMTVWVAAWGD
jgi:hypothetical protein